MTFRINIIDPEDENENENEDNENENVLAQGSVALWVMIEDSCSILRQVSSSGCTILLYCRILSYISCLFTLLPRREVEDFRIQLSKPESS